MSLEYELYRNRFQGKRLFVCGNAPSLAETYPLLKGQHVFGCNWLRLWKELPFMPDFFGLTEPVSRGLKDRLEMGRGATHRFILSQHGLPSDIGWVWLPKLQPHSRDDMIQGSGLSDADPFRTGANTPLNIGIQFGAYMGFTEFYLLGLEIPPVAAAKAAHVYASEDEMQFYEDVNRKPPFDLDYLNAGYERAWRDMEEQGKTLVNCTPRGHFKDKTKVPYRPIEEVLAS